MPQNIIIGKFYKTLTTNRKDDDDLKSCIEETVLKLVRLNTSLKKPGVLLGKIQSGKTRAFIGVIALAFDNGYDIVIVLTKGTKALAEQTIKRLRENPEGFGLFEDDNQVQIHDVMSFPDSLPEFVLSQKLILVSKKEDDNLKRLIKAITVTYPGLQNKKVLVIDDEADFASISFHKEKENGAIKQGKIAKLIDEVRTKVKQSDFLQVTATPYSLYLQPDDSDGQDGLFPPKRPAFTVLLPIHDNYVGGDYYFIESEDDGSPASHVYEELPLNELNVLNVSKRLKRADRRLFKIEEVFTSSNANTLKNSIVNFIVGGCIRRLQQEQTGEKQQNYSLVIHTDIHRISHAWQEELVKKLKEELVGMVKNNPDLFKRLVSEAYKNLKPSIELAGFNIPKLDDVLTNVSRVLINGMLFVQQVNSKKDVNALLDSKGQLKLWAPLNIFIGGQILDRGITIKNMIGFYYGRNPKKFQQDTVLQHSRMYGARSKEDLAVTRFYTTRNIYEIMCLIHEFDNALRDAFLNGSHEKGVYFIRKDASDRLVPCSPNKIMLSNITTLKPYKRLLPVGFQTDYKTNIKKDIKELDKEILGLQTANQSNYFMISVEQAITILEKIKKTLLMQEKGYEWDIKAHKASLEHLSKNSLNNNQRGKIWILIRKNRNISRIQNDGSYSDQPDNPETDQRKAKELAINIPIMMLFRENGLKEQGWNGSPFWWPVVMTPKNTHTTIFTSNTADY